MLPPDGALRDSTPLDRPVMFSGDLLSSFLLCFVRRTTSLTKWNAAPEGRPLVACLPCASALMIEGLSARERCGAGERSCRPVAPSSPTRHRLQAF